MANQNNDNNDYGNGNNVIHPLATLVLDTFGAEMAYLFEKAIQTAEYKATLEQQAKASDEIKRQKCEESIKESKKAQQEAKKAQEKCNKIITKVDNLIPSYYKVLKYHYKLLIKQEKLQQRLSEENQTILTILQYNCKQFPNTELPKELKNALQKAQQLQQEYRQANINFHLGGQEVGDITSKGNISLTETNTG